jgi:hypothetical protein
MIKIAIVSSVGNLELAHDIVCYQLHSLAQGRDYIRIAREADNNFLVPFLILVDCCILDDELSYSTKPKGTLLAEEFHNSKAFSISKIAVYNIAEAAIHNLVNLSGLTEKTGLQDGIYYFQDGDIKIIINDLLKS